MEPATKGAGQGDDAGARVQNVVHVARQGGAALGALDPDQIHLPSIYVQRIFQGTGYEKPIEQRTVRQREGA